PELSRGRKLAIVAAGIVTVLVLIAAVVGFWAHSQLFPSGAGADAVVVDVPTGSSTSAIADLLQNKGVISNAFLFKLYMRWKGAEAIKAGQYRLPKHGRADVVLRSLKAGPLPPPTRRFTVPPGLNIRQVPAQVVTSLPTL